MSEHHVHVFVAIDGGEPVKVGTTSVSVMAPEGVGLAVAEIGTALTRDVATRALDFDDEPPAWHPNVGDRVQVTYDGERLRGLMVHHAGRVGVVTALRDNLLDRLTPLRVDVELTGLGIVTFSERELEARA